MERSCQVERAFSLVEVVLALGISTFAIIAIIGLLPMTMKSNRDTIDETRAITLMEDMIADRRHSPSAAQSARYALPPLNATARQTQQMYLKEDGQIVTSAQGARYRVAATMYPASGFGQPAFLHLSTAWPASTNSAANAVEMTAAIAP